MLPPPSSTLLGGIKRPEGIFGVGAMGIRAKRVSCADTNNSNEIRTGPTCGTRRVGVGSCTPASFACPRWCRSFRMAPPKHQIRNRSTEHGMRGTKPRQQIGRRRGGNTAVIYKNRACVGKIPYPTRDAALKTRDKLIRDRRMQRPLAVYQCPVCGLFHLGADRERLQNRERRR